MKLYTGSMPKTATTATCAAIGQTHKHERAAVLRRAFPEAMIWGTIRHPVTWTLSAWAWHAETVRRGNTTRIRQAPGLTGRSLDLDLDVLQAAPAPFGFDVQPSAEGLWSRCVRHWLQFADGTWAVDALARMERLDEALGLLGYDVELRRENVGRYVPRRVAASVWLSNAELAGELGYSYHPEPSLPPVWRLDA